MNYDFYGKFIPLPDGSVIGFRRGHTPFYKDIGSKRFGYNLYKIDVAGNKIFLGGGSTGGIDKLYIYKGCAYWNDFFPLKCNLNGSEFLDRQNEQVTQEYEEILQLVKNFKQL